LRFYYAVAICDFLAIDENPFVFFVKYLVGLCVKKILEWQSFNTTKEYKHKDPK